MVPRADQRFRPGGRPGKVVPVSSHDGVVLLDDKPSIAGVGGDVLDEGSEARSTGGQIGPISADGVVDGAWIFVAARAETMIRRRRACSCFIWIRR